MSYLEKIQGLKYSRNHDFWQGKKKMMSSDYVWVKYSQ